MLPIPLRLLIHEATLNEVVTDKWGAEQDKLRFHLKQVRFEPSTRIVHTADNADVQCTATLFIDAVSSWPIGVTPDVGNSVVWDGRRYKVQDVQRLYDERKLHHLEVELSDG